MRTAGIPIVREIVLAGGGHAHVEVLRAFAMRPLEGVRLTLVAPDSQTPYSGMLPGHIAGLYSKDETFIDVRRLASVSGARFICAAACGVDLGERRLLLEGRPSVRFDALSLNLGSTPPFFDIPGAAEHALPVKPVEPFLAALREIEAAGAPEGRALRLTLVGAGAAGVEVALSLHHRFSKTFDVEITVIDRAPGLVPSHAPGVRRQLAAAMDAAGIRQCLGHGVASVSNEGVVLESGEQIPVDHVLWMTGAAPSPWLAETGLPLDPRGFVRIGPDLRAIGTDAVFAVGDCASMYGTPRPKSGVYAVRQGPALAENLRRLMLRQSLRPHRPQTRVLGLISTGRAHAVASWGPVAIAGDWVWRWKDRIDRTFMDRYGDMPPMTEGLPKSADTLPESTQLAALHPIRCAGCGAKIGGGPLARALARLGLDGDGPEDVAPIPQPPGTTLVESVDYFPALVSDPYLFGRIAANHALSDLYASGAQPVGALALAVLPPGGEDVQEEDLFQMLSGVRDTLRAEGAGLLGGHTAEGAELALGLTVTGAVGSEGVISKRGVQPGDTLVLTKPLGTGAIFAAEMRGEAKGEWVDGAIDSMLRSNRPAAEALRARGVRAMTDVTGFGLGGHLAEMLQGTGLTATLDIDVLPVLPGAQEVLAQGIESSLAPANRGSAAALSGGDATVTALLADPQTSGGLLACIPKQVNVDKITEYSMIGVVVSEG